MQQRESVFLKFCVGGIRDSRNCHVGRQVVGWSVGQIFFCDSPKKKKKDYLVPAGDGEVRTFERIDSLQIAVSIVFSMLERGEL